MESKQLYSLETHTLLTLYQKTASIEVRQQFSQIYYLGTKEFAVLYLLALSHPNVVSYEDIITALSAYKVGISGRKDLKLLISKLKPKLSSYKVKNLIIHARSTGYAISNKWVEPAEYEDKRLFNKVIRYFRKLSAGFAMDAKNNKDVA